MDHLDEVEFLWETKCSTTHGFFMAWVGVGRVDYPTAIDNIAPTPSREGKREGDFFKSWREFFLPFSKPSPSSSSDGERSIGFPLEGTFPPFLRTFFYETALSEHVDVAWRRRRRQMRENLSSRSGGGGQKRAN